MFSHCACADESTESDSEENPLNSLGPRTQTNLYDDVHWDQLQKCGCFSERHLNTLRDSWASAFPWATITRLPAMVCLCLEILHLKSGVLSAVGNWNVKVLGIMVAFCYLLISMMVPFVSRRFAAGASLRELLENDVHMPKLDFSMVDSEALLIFILLAVAVLHAERSLRSFSFVLVFFLPVFFPNGARSEFVYALCIMHAERMRMLALKRNSLMSERTKQYGSKVPESKDEFWADYLVSLLNFTDQIYGVFSDTQIWLSLKFGNSVFASVCFAVAALVLVNEREFWWASGAAGLSFYGAYTAISHISSMAAVSDTCMRKDHAGLYGAVLANGRYLTNMSQREVLAFQEVMRNFEVRKIGAHKFGIVVDWTLVVTAVVASGASFFSVFRQAYHSISGEA